MRKAMARSGVGLLIERLAVILSILVAFGLDAWWDARQLRVDLLEDLTSVTEEVEGNIAALEVESLFHRTAGEHRRSRVEDR